MQTAKMLLSKCLFLIVCSTASDAATYFVDSHRGNDSNAGTSRRKPWRTLEKVNSTQFLPGDEVRFLAGSSWASQLIITQSGMPGKPVIFRSDGTGPRPRIYAAGHFEDAVLVSNAQHVVYRDFEITNRGAVGSSTNTPVRRGVHIVADNIGTLTNIVISGLFIHDVNGTQKIKHNGGIIFTTRGERTSSRFQGLKIERNILWRVDRSGIVAQSYHAGRNRWFPSTHVVIRDNWLGDIGGDGITPWATDGCLVEHNILVGANERAGTYNAGIWPWSTDNTIMRLNRASAVKTLMDGQGFDADYNSRNTLIEYNLSHDNDGGFLLMCTPGNRKPAENYGNSGTVVRHNISRHDRNRIIHIAGAVEQAQIYRNAFYIPAVADVQLLFMSDWNGWANGIEFKNNLVHSSGLARYGHQVSRNYQTGAYLIEPGWGPATNILCSGNARLGRHTGYPSADTSLACAPRSINFADWPGPQFDPSQPQNFPRFLKSHRAWMLRLMKSQFGKAPAAS